MAQIDKACDVYHRKTLNGEHLGIVWACPECKQRIEDEVFLQPLPEGCVYRLLWLHWAIRAGRIGRGDTAAAKRKRKPEKSGRGDMAAA